LDTIFFKAFFVALFELPSLRNTRKRDKTKKVEKRLTSKFLSIFFGKVFDMGFLQKYFNAVFELPLPRNDQKRTKQKSQKKYVGWLVPRKLFKYTSGSVIFLEGPLLNFLNFLGE
jgi:hypothetical protein